MLILQRKAGESLVIGEDITVRVVSVDGARVRLAMEEATPAELLDLLGGVLDHKTQTPASPGRKED